MAGVLELGSCWPLGPGNRQVDKQEAENGETNSFAFLF